MKHWSNLRKFGFCLSFLLYSLFFLWASVSATVGAVLFPLFLGNAVTFFLALYAVFRPIPSTREILNARYGKAGLTGLLILGLGLSQVQASELNDPSSFVKSTTEDRRKDSVIAGCAVLVIGAVIIYGVWKVCKKLDHLLPPPPPPPKATNAPPITNQLGPILNSPTRLNNPDVDLGPTDGWQTVVVALQGSEDGQHWNTEHYVTNWLCATQMISVTADGSGVPLLTNAQPVYWTNDAVLVNLSSLQAVPREELKEYRMILLR